VAARELAERRGVAGFREREFRGDQELARFESGGVEAREEILGGDAALALLSRGDEGRCQRERTGRQLRSGIPERAAPAESAAVADRRVRDALSDLDFPGARSLAVFRGVGEFGFLNAIL